MKRNIGLSILAVSLMVISGQMALAQTESKEKGMIKVTIMYPNEEGKTFDMEYYSTKHMPMVARVLGQSMKSWEIDKGIAEGHRMNPFHIWPLVTCISKNWKTIRHHSDPMRSRLPVTFPITPILCLSSK